MEDNNGNNIDPSNNNNVRNLYIKINKIIKKLKQYHNTNLIISTPLFNINSDKSVLNNFIFSNLKDFSYKKDFPLINFFPQIEDSFEIESLWATQDHLEIENCLVIEDHLEIEEIIINTKINKLHDLIELCNKYPLKKNVKYNINMESLHKIKKYLIKLNEMIGMHKLKKTIINQILYYIQNLHINTKTNEGDYMHTVIHGPPGTGKTEVAKIMGKIFTDLNVLSNGKFNKVTRADLIAGYLGQTAIKTKEAISNSLGGVLFIDEAYSLGNKEKRDSFAKECIDTLCEALSNYKNNLMVIIAGYKEELNKCFFNYNSGLNSRFIWRFDIDDYTPEELKLIFKKKVNETDWKIKTDLETSWFSKHMKYFKYFGRDMETLFTKTKIAHGRRVFCEKDDIKKIISNDDLENGFKMFLENDEVKKRVKNEINHSYLYI